VELEPAIIPIWPLRLLFLLLLLMPALLIPPLLRPLFLATVALESRN
jgi:hypothetical protein